MVFLIQPCHGRQKHREESGTFHYGLSFFDFLRGVARPRLVRSRDILCNGNIAQKLAISKIRNASTAKSPVFTGFCRSATSFSAPA
jgi:hypothetical protein